MTPPVDLDAMLEQLLSGNNPTRVDAIALIDRVKTAERARDGALSAMAAMRETHPARLRRPRAVGVAVQRPQGGSVTTHWIPDATYPDRSAFRVTVRSLPEDDCGFSADVHEVSGWDGDTNEPSLFEPYLHCLIKWDSCSHFYFGEEEEKDGYLHLCGAADFRNHAALMGHLYRLAFESMGRDPMEGEAWA